jgi:Bap31/Bap29 transmembrane region
MVTIANLIASVVMPSSAFILALLLFPLAPNFLLRNFSRYLWDLSLSVSKYRLKLVHLMLVISFFMFVAKANEYYELSVASSEDPHFELAIDLKMKVHRCGRDFYIMGTFFAIWIYIWRVISLVSKLVN